MEKPHTNCGDKKLWDLRPANLNPLYEIKLHRLTWPLYPKDLLSNTYNLIHVLEGLQKDEGLQTKIQRPNPWMKYRE